MKLGLELGIGNTNSQKIVNIKTEGFHVNFVMHSSASGANTNSNSTPRDLSFGG